MVQHAGTVQHGSTLLTSSFHFAWLQEELREREAAWQARQQAEKRWVAHGRVACCVQAAVGRMLLEARLQGCSAPPFSHDTMVCLTGMPAPLPLVIILLCAQAQAAGGAAAV